MVLEEFVGASEFSTHGERVVHGQRLMQAASDVLLEWVRFQEGADGRVRDYYVRQLEVLIVADIVRTIIVDTNDRECCRPQLLA